MNNIFYALIVKLQMKYYKKRCQNLVSKQIARWQACLSIFYFNTESKKGESHSLPDLFNETLRQDKIDQD